MNEEFEKARAEMIEEMSEAKKQTILFESIEEKIIQLVSEIKEVKDDARGKWKIEQKWHNIGTVIALFTFFVTASIGVLSCILVAIGLYYMPEETKALFDTVLNMAGMV